jgi:hypothetical protein
MELVDGPNLQEVMQPPKGHPQLGVLEIRDMLSQLLGAVCYVHRRGIIHRDLKPANILVAQRNPLRIKLADFSEATMSESFKPGQFVGTPPYTAPEMINGPDCTQKVDMFAIGVIALQLLYGLPEALQKLKQRRQVETPVLKAILETILRWRDSLLESHRSVMLDFVCGLLQETPRHRHSADESLQHGFFQAQLDDALVPAAAVPDLATQIYNPNPQRDYTNEYLDMQRRSAEEAADMPDTMLWDPEEAGLQGMTAKEAEDMPDTLWLGPDPEDIELQDARADNILDDAPQAGSVDLQSLSAPTVPQARRRSSELSRPTDTGQHDRNDGPTAMQLLEEYKRRYGSVVPTGEGDLARPEQVGSGAVHVHDGLHVIVVHSRIVTMDASDFRVNATQIYLAAVEPVEGRKLPAFDQHDHFPQSTYYRRFKSLGVMSKRPGDGRSNWLPFRYGYFLSQAVGLESELAALFSCANEAPPKREENFLIWKKKNSREKKPPRIGEKKISREKKPPRIGEKKISREKMPPRTVYDNESVRQLRHLKPAPIFLTEPALDENPGADDVGHKDDSEGYGAAQSQVRFIQGSQYSLANEFMFRRLCFRMEMGICRSWMKMACQNAVIRQTRQTSIVRITCRPGIGYPGMTSLPRMASLPRMTRRPGMNRHPGMTSLPRMTRHPGMTREPGMTRQSGMASLPKMTETGIT